MNGPAISGSLGGLVIPELHLDELALRNIKTMSVVCERAGSVGQTAYSRSFDAAGVGVSNATGARDKVG